MPTPQILQTVLSCQVSQKVNPKNHPVGFLFSLASACFLCILLPFLSWESRECNLVSPVPSLLFFFRFMKQRGGFFPGLGKLQEAYFACGKACHGNTAWVDLEIHKELDCLGHLTEHLCSQYILDDDPSSLLLHPTALCFLLILLPHLVSKRPNNYPLTCILHSKLWWQG
jgi:hypothetical protein